MVFSSNASTCFSESFILRHTVRQAFLRCMRLRGVEYVAHVYCFVVSLMRYYVGRMQLVSRIRSLNEDVIPLKELVAAHQVRFC